MFGIGLPEMIVILAVALIVVGPEKLPELARSLAKGVNELRGAMSQIKESLNEESKVISSVGDELRQTAGQMRDSLLDEPGGPRRLPDDAAAAEAGAEAQPSALRPWERDAEAGRTEAATPAPQAAPPETPAQEAAAGPAEESAVGRNPAPAA